MSEPCKVCGIAHRCVFGCGRMADGGYHICGDCREQLRASYWWEVEHNPKWAHLRDYEKDIPQA